MLIPTLNAYTPFFIFQKNRRHFQFGTIKPALEMKYEPSIDPEFPVIIYESSCLPNL
jgi:hypothetical protein